jgi:hypothetical protein
MSIAVVCVVGAFLALIAGSALRTEFTTSSLPEPGAWSHAIHHGEIHTHVSRDSMSNNTKPFRNVWMTHDRPAKRAARSASADLFVLPKSFASPAFQLRRDHSPAHDTISLDRNILVLNCVDRR